MQKMSRVVGYGFILLFAFPVWGQSSGVSLNLAAFYSTDKYDYTQIGSGQGEATYINYDVLLGYKMATDLYLGGIYGILNTDNGSSNTMDKYMGVSVGFRPGGWEITGHYFLSAESELSTTSKIKNGTGFGLDLAYLWSLGATFFFGPQISYRKFSYTKWEHSGTESKANTSKSYTLPYFVIAIHF